MAVMGIESSAHTLGVGIVDNGKILANERRMYKISNKGIVPSTVADFHSGNVYGAIRDAIKASHIRLEDISAIGYTRGPGLGACLRIGYLAAYSISSELKIPIIPINHGVAHIEIARHLNKFKDPLALYVSGGNSQILGIVEEPYRHYHIYGETFDMGVGNMLDSFARKAGMNPAWGSSVAKAAEFGSYIRMPYTVKGMDFTFSGLMTNAIAMLKKFSIHDVSYSLQETAFSMLCEATERAMMLTGKSELLICGGVAQSFRLREMLSTIAQSHNGKFGFAPNEYNADNGAMIALVAEKMHNGKYVSRQKNLDVKQRYRVDEAKITW